MADLPADIVSARSGRRDYRIVPPRSRRPDRAGLADRMVEER
jgi:hypothetical protein